jgi:tetratricopeptide (TPR) repeat protein
MIYCPKCGEENPEDSLYCQNCKFPLALVSRYVASPDSIDSSTITFSKGYSLGKRYQIIEELGRGGMGIVYKAKDLMLNDYVALKLLLPQLTTDVEVMDRFKREVLAARKVSHPNVVKVYDIGEKDDITFISMEYLVGIDLKKKLRGSGALVMEEAVNIITQICSGLEAAHEMGVIHRDIKPQNILITKNNQVKLMDFGIARAGDLTGMTTAGTLVGTPEYMSPEQADPKKVVDNRTDIYSLGIVMYEMFCGRVPFRADTPIETVIKHLMEEPEPLRFANPKVSPAIDYIVMKTVQKDPDKRYQKAKDIALDFEKYVLKKTETIDLRKSELVPTIKIPKKAPPSKKIPIKEAPSEVTSKKDFLKLLAAGLAIVVVAVIGYFIYSHFKEQKQQIANLTQKAQAAFQQEHYMEPPQENALKFANDILTIDKNNKFAIDLKSSIADIYRNQADEHFKAEKWSEAGTEYDQLLKIVPNDEKALNRINQIQNIMGGGEKITPAAELDKDKRITALTKRAQEAYNRKQFVNPSNKSALRYANEIIAIDKDNKFASGLKVSIVNEYRSLAEKSERTQNWSEALKNYNLLLKVKPKDGEALRRIAELENRIKEAKPAKVAATKETEDFNIAKRADTIDGWQRFLNQYPRSQNRSYALQRIDYLNREKRAFEQASAEDNLDKWNKFMSQFPNSKYVRQARQRIQQLSSMPGRIVISAYPLAEAYLDGKKVGSTPPVLRLEASPGKHKIKLEIKDYESYTEEVTVSSNKETTFHHAFKPFGSLVVNCTPWAYISIDGKDRGTTPFTLKKISEGEHKVVLSREGFKPLEKLVEIKARETARLVLNLEKE